MMEASVSPAESLSSEASNRPTSAAEPHSAGLTSPREEPAGLMKAKLDKALNALGQAPEAERVLEVLAEYPGAIEMACLNPRCAEACAWPSDGGRPQAFCSLKCRRTYARERESLLAQVLWLERYLTSEKLGRAGKVIQRRLGVARWMLVRYPALD